MFRTISAQVHHRVGGLALTISVTSGRSPVPGSLEVLWQKTAQLAMARRFLHTGHMSHALLATWHCAHLPSLAAVSTEAPDLGEMGQPLFTVKPKQDK